MHKYVSDSWTFKIANSKSIPVVSINYIELLKDPKQKIVFIPLAWNFYEEIKNKKANSIISLFTTRITMIR